MLQNYESDGAKFLFNTYLPTANGGDTEIDVIMIYKSGIYVFECKNFIGWIFGNEHDNQWTQCTMQGRRRKSRKEHFYNPLKQNSSHCKAVQNIIGNNYPITPVVAFNDTCTFKEVPMGVYYFQNVPMLIKHNEILSEEQINTIYNQLYPYTQVTDSIKQQHIENIMNFTSKKLLR